MNELFYYRLGKKRGGGSGGGDTGGGASVIIYKGIVSAEIYAGTYTIVEG